MSAEPEILREAADPRRGAVLATIVAVKGSVPRHAGSTMLIRADGSILGSVGGGRGELLALEAGRRLAAAGGDALIEVEMLGTEVAGEAMICGGLALILLESLGSGPPSPDRGPAIYRRALELLSSGGRALLAKRIRKEGEAVSVETGLFDEEGRLLAGSAGGVEAEAASRALRAGKAAFDEAGGLFLDPLFPAEKLLILGAGHVGLAIARAARGLGFRIFLADQRPDFLLPGRLPEGVTGLGGAFEATIADFDFDASTYAVVVSPGHRHDFECLRAILGRSYRYAGFIGSGRKVALLLAQAREEGFPEEKIAGLFAPIGLDIEAETPEEIALAVLGEIIAVRRGAKALRDMSISRRAPRS